MRGKLKQLGAYSHSNRIIPARAGQTRLGQCVRQIKTDHPRACGANPQVIAALNVEAGSSPRVRGKPHLHTRLHHQGRIIPARAGQTPTSARHRPRETDHPRACGANAFSSPLAGSTTGSSPRVRGKPKPWSDEVDALRIIPARAGQTRPAFTSSTSAPDHPRACGANSSDMMIFLPSVGSSPRVRGKPLPFLPLGHRRRIIPARAGQTALVRDLIILDADHPRACGANQVSACRIYVHYGSSPRVRGKQSDFMRKLLSAGPSIIGFAQWLQSSCYCSCFQSSAKTPISRGTTPTSLFLGFQNSITLLLLT